MRRIVIVLLVLNALVFGFLGIMLARNALMFANSGDANTASVTLAAALLSLVVMNQWISWAVSLLDSDSQKK